MGYKLAKPLALRCEDLSRRPDSESERKKDKRPVRMVSTDHAGFQLWRSKQQKKLVHEGWRWTCMKHHEALAESLAS